jgi:hypothetical protein
MVGKSAGVTAAAGGEYKAVAVVRGKPRPKMAAIAAIRGRLKLIDMHVSFVGSGDFLRLLLLDYHPYVTTLRTDQQLAPV